MQGLFRKIYRLTMNQKQQKLLNQCKYKINELPVKVVE